MFDPTEIFNKLKLVDQSFYTQEVCREIAGKLDRIVDLKKEKKAVLLAHNYQRPEIFEVADYTGDSLGLSLQAGEVKSAEVIVFCGVHFMAETAKVVSPDKIVLLPNIQAGCSLADTADSDDVADKIDELRIKYPDLGVVCYVNTTAAVKALSDSVCTSSNAVEVVRALPNDTILFLPDENLARYVSNQIPEKEIIPWKGNCYVHQELEPESIHKAREQHPDMQVLVHPECRDDVVELADAVMSTSGMVTFAQNSSAKEFLAVTECGLSDLLTIQVQEKQFYRVCNVCRYMKMITLDNIITSLENLKPEIQLDEETRHGAERSIRKMFELTTSDKVPVSLC
ncbi:MAG: quinolinate synthase NadA [Calditrichaeota bacterium]|nr:quinolinate synthase NadA [Calditrichota bacterium]MBT7618727.1 quinolinate synthase NadA [Calditrichota bacterium]MBT7787886.1 quinolinate synthase NadA [Calditrichota bacterium]